MFKRLPYSITTIYALVLLFLNYSCQNEKGFIFIEAESFESKGGWVVDQQFMAVMGSPYLMAHGIGKVVDNARTSVEIPSSGDYRLYIRTKNWTVPFTDSPTPGIFKIKINDSEIPFVFGNGSGSWHWEDGSVVSLKKGKSVISLEDLTGFNGRIDALLLTSDLNYTPPDSLSQLGVLRKQWLGLADNPQIYDQFDLVVVGGGIAGISASVSAARLGLKVALVHNRPVLGGNNSSEIRVWRSGKTQTGKYPALGRIVNELGPDKSESVLSGKTFGDSVKLALVEAEKNISIFLNYHVNNAVVTENRIISVKAVNIDNSSEVVLKAPLFADCTGDANLGFLAGADYREGSESKEQTGESRASESESNQVLGSSIFWWSRDTGAESSFPDCLWAYNITEENCQYALQSAWNWESGFSGNMVLDFEKIRDNHLRAVFGNWSFQKNMSSRKKEFANYEIAELGYIMGKRESRRMLGDIILTQQDLDGQVEYPDGCVEINWGIDIHIPDPYISKFFPGQEFKAVAVHYDKEKAPPFSVPYRCLYSRNISNLFMAGRHISTTHVAHAATRVQRYTGTYGEVVGIAASLCRKYKTDPRGLYETYLHELKKSLADGVPASEIKN
jgi:hypothetical protein